MNFTQSTRRKFLKQTAGITAAATAGPLIWTRSSRGQANDRLNIAAIGVGGRGSDIGHQAGRLANMVACADVHADNAARFAERYEGKCEVYEDYRKILDRDDVDAITCGTPDHWHTKIAIDAMEAGKHVYCEKPLTLTIDESKQIMAATERTGRIFQVGTQRIWAGVSQGDRHRTQRAVGRQAACIELGGQRDRGWPVRVDRAAGKTQLRILAGTGATSRLLPAAHRLGLPLVA